MRGQLRRPQVPASDLHLLRGHVAGQADDLRPVQQRRRHGVELVGGQQEQHTRQIEAHVQVMIHEIGVLLRIEHLQQRRSRIAAEIRADLVHLVDHDHRIGHLHALQRLDQLARHGADIGTPVPLDLRLVAHAADRETVERPADRLGDGPAQRGLADTRRADEQHNGATDLLLTAADGDELEDAVLDVIQARMVLVQGSRGRFQAEAILGELAPGQADQPVQIVARHAVFRRALIEGGKLGHFFVEDLLRLLREHQALGPLLQRLQLLFARVLVHAQFAADLMQLLVQEELALLSGYLLLDVFPDTALHLADVKLAVQQRDHLLQAVEDRIGGQDILQLLSVGSGEAGCEIGQAVRFVDADTGCEQAQLLLVQRIVLQKLLDGVDDRHRIGADLQVILVGGFIMIMHAGAQRLALDEGFDAEAVQAFDHQVQAVSLKLHRLDHLGHDADIVQVTRLERLRLVAQQHQSDMMLVPLGQLLHAVDDLLALVDQRHHQPGKQRPVGQRQQGQIRRQHLAGHGNAAFLGLWLPGGRWIDNFGIKGLITHAFYVRSKRWCFQGLNFHPPVPTLLCDSSHDGGRSCAGSKAFSC